MAARLRGYWFILDNRWLSLVEDIQVRQMVRLFVLDQTGVRKFAPPIMADVRSDSAARSRRSAPGSLCPSIASGRSRLVLHRSFDLSIQRFVLGFSGEECRDERDNGQNYK